MSGLDCIHASSNGTDSEVHEKPNYSRRSGVVRVILKQGLSKLWHGKKHTELACGGKAYYIINKFDVER